MNKNKIILAITAFFLIIPGCSKKKPEKEEKPVVEVSEYSYTVTKFRNNVNWSINDSVWQPVSLELSLIKGSWVETGLRSFSILEGSLGDVVILGERTKARLLIEELSQHSASTTKMARGMQLLRGIVRFNIKNHHSGFIVETPSAKIRVKGTLFTVTYSEKTKATDIRVEEGAVEVEDKKKPGEIKLLKENETMVKIGTEETIRRKLNAKDRSILKRFQDILKDTSGGMIKSPSSSRDVKEVRKGLSSQAHTLHGKETIEEKVRAEKSMDKVRTQFSDDKKKEYNDYNTYKKKKIVELDSQKKSASSILDKERKEFKKETASEIEKDSSSSKSAFDELRRRKIENK